MDLGLAGHVIAVTGGGEGIGAAITRVCLEEGATVAVVSRLTLGVETFIREMQDAGRPCELIQAELHEAVECQHAVAEIERRFGRLNALVNNAGVNDGVGLEAGSPERFVESLKLNLLHYYCMAHYALPMLKVSRGSIVNIASKVALTGQGGTSGYAAAKGAQLALTREWAAELLPYGMRVNAVLPAEVLTPLYERWISSRPDPDAAMRRIEESIPLGKRMTTAAELAATVVFLLSPTQSSHTTGQQLVVDGGYTHLDRALTQA